MFNSLFSFSSRNILYTEFSSFSLCSRLHQPEDSKCNVSDLANCQNQFRQRKFFNEKDVNVHVHFGSSHPPVSLKIKTAASFIWEMGVITKTN